MRGKREVKQVEEMPDKANIFLLKQVQGFPLTVELPDGGPTDLFLLQMRGRHVGDDEDRTSPLIAFMDHRAVMSFATKVLEWGCEAFGYGVRTQIVDGTELVGEAGKQPEDAPVKTGQYL